jgi:hypothetical protein
MGSMKDLFGDKPYVLPTPVPKKAFDGDTYETKRDHKRLSGQLWHVFNVMKDGQWKTLGRIAAQVEGTEAAISARLRDLRKSKYGTHKVERRHVIGGLYEYRLIVNET